MFKKIAFTITVIVLLGLLAVWSPWSNWNISFLELLGLKQEDKYAGLQVYSIAGEISLEIDNELVGNVTVEGSPLDIFEIEPGEHLITLKRQQEDGSNTSYYEVNRIINFIEGVNTVVAYELGPNENFSEGYVIYLTSSISKEKSYLNLNTSPDEAEIYINGTKVSNSPLTNHQISFDESYKISIKKQGYEEISFDLLADNKDQLTKLKEYDINVDVSLFQLPIEIRENYE